MERLVEGYRKFLSEVFEPRKESFLSLARAPHQPCHTLVVSCSDSRVIPEVITQAEPGELFVVRNVANIVPPLGEEHSSAGAAVEYALGHLPEIRFLVVMGHYGCGGMKALLEPPKEEPQEPSLSRWLSLSLEARRRLEAELPEASFQDRWDRLVEINVLLQMEHLGTYPQVARALREGRLELLGWVYDLASGRIKAYRPEEGFQWL
jgi:carbonic anhydrase